MVAAMLPLVDLDYPLDQSLIARAPANPRDAARLLVLKRSDPTFLVDAIVRDLPDFLSPADLLVVNNTTVIPARLLGFRSDTQGAVEGLYLGHDEAHLKQPPEITPPAEAAGLPPEFFVRCFLRGKRMKPGIIITLLDQQGEPSSMRLAVLGHSQEEGEEISFRCVLMAPVTYPTVIAALEAVGRPPLPPYILAARKRDLAGEEEIDSAEAPAAVDRLATTRREDAQQYQTTYADPQQAGSVAAPTAGLHFTPELLASLAAKGIDHAAVTLHVGSGTFKPVKTQFVEQHQMHAEWCTIPANVTRQIAQRRGALSTKPSQGGRVIPVGTTSMRTLESFSHAQFDEASAGNSPLEAWTKLLLTPGHTFQHAHGLMTNFHLPQTTLLALVAALLDHRSGHAEGEGVPRLLAAYRHAMEKKYRFFSFGDSMLILP